MKNISFQHDVLPMKDKLYRLALRITLNAQDAEDIVQETLIRIWNRRDNWDKIDSMESWGLTIARNLAIDMVRKNDAHRTISLDEGNDTSAANGDNNDSTAASNANKAVSITTPYERLQETERMQIVRDLMNTLPEKQRTAMQLRDFEEKSYKEIASIMDISEEQVKVNIYRARQYIKQKYSEISQYGL